MKKGLLIGCGVVTALVAVCGGAVVLLVYVVFAVTGEAVTATDNLLALIAAGKTAEAYRSTASALQAQQSEAQFAESMKRLGLTEHQSALWTNRQIKNNQATLEGSVTTRTGSTIPLTVQLVKEGDAWKVLSIQGPQVGAAVQAPPIPAPVPMPMPMPADGAKNKPDLLPRELMARMTKETLLEFNKAVQSGDFGPFHRSTAKQWQEETTPEKIKEVFKDFVTQKIDIGGIEKVEPVLDPAKIDDKGFLVLSGHYPVMPNRVKFELKYLSEGDAWKLIGINVQVGE